MRYIPAMMSDFAKRSVGTAAFALLGLAVVGAAALRRTITTPLQRWSTAGVLALAATAAARSGSMPPSIRLKSSATATAFR